MKVVRETLGLSTTITVAADTYTSVLPQLNRKSAEDVAALIRPIPPCPSNDAPAAQRSPRTTGRASLPGARPDREAGILTCSRAVVHHRGAGEDLVCGVVVGVRLRVAERGRGHVDGLSGSEIRFGP